MKKYLFLLLLCFCYLLSGGCGKQEASASPEGMEQREGIFGKEMVIHRLVGITDEGGYIFQGDNNMEPDRGVLREQIGYRIVWY